MKKKKILLLISIIVITLILIVGVALAAFSYNKTGANRQLVVGDIYMHYRETTTNINIGSVFPTNSYIEGEYFEFTIDGKNTNTEGDILYNIQVTKGDSVTGKERIADKFLRFRLVKVENNQEIELVNNESYETINNTTIYSDMINKGTNSEIEYIYRLYVWISDEVQVGNIEGVDYTSEEWNKLFASVKVNVNGKYSEGEILATAIKNKLGTEGVVAVNTDGNLYDGTGEIREYRYSGLGNYCTYTDGTNDYNLNVEDNTCPQTVCAADLYQIGAPFIINGDTEGFTMMGVTCADFGGTSLNLKVENSTPTDSGLRNYVEFNGELWRIIGVFGENVKIVKDTPLTNDVYTKETYTSGDTIYKLNSAYNNSTVKYGYFYYKLLSDGSYNNDWTTSGVMHFLNDTTANSYYTTGLSSTAKNMIQETTYYLGNVNPTTITPSGFYTEERGNVVCADTITSNSHESNCNIWSGNQATWTGDVSLIYPSDYMYATPTTGWNLTGEDIVALLTTFRESWMSNTTAETFWLLSPSSNRPSDVWRWDYSGSIIIYYAHGDYGLRPSLNLKSDVIVIEGDGSYKNPYKLLES